MKREWIRPFFIVAAAYDFILGVLFMVAHGAVYERFGVTPPNHPAYIQFAASRYDEAIRLARESLRQRADFVGAHRVLAAASGMAGDRELSAIALQGLRQVQPDISLQWIARELPMKKPEDREHYLDGLRRAGLK